MSPMNVGGYVAPVEQVRESVEVNVSHSQANVANDDDCAFGFTREKAFEASQGFITLMQDLSDYIVERESEQNLDPADADYEVRVAQTILLDPKDAVLVRVMRELRQHGSSLYGQLKNELKDQFRNMGFNVRPPGSEIEPPSEFDDSEPALTFRERIQQEGEMPILWEIMYEATKFDKLNWMKFWGFRVPISYWVTLPRREEINLRNGLFSAINEELHFAGKEVDLLVSTQYLSDAGISLADILRDRVQNILNGLHRGDEAAVITDILRERMQSILEQHQEIEQPDWSSKCWLIDLLNWLIDHKAMDENDVNDWIDNTWVDMLDKSRGRYGLVHFACHCDSASGSKFLAKLRMTVAGKEMPLHVGLIPAQAAASKPRNIDPGPLVFLNACNTGEPSKDRQAPEFPLQWIYNQRALAVLTTLVRVPDYFAYKFAERFYTTLFGLLPPNTDDPDIPLPSRHHYVAEALLYTRRHFMRKYNNPLGLAYVLYAVPGACIDIDQ